MLSSALLRTPYDILAHMPCDSLDPVQKVQSEGAEKETLHKAIWDPA